MKKSRSKFVYMVFTGGADGDIFVAHAEKYTKEEVIRLAEQEYDYLIKIGRYRKPEIEDIDEEYIRWFVRVPYWCGHESEDGGCYSFCGNGERGSFKVYSISLKKLLL